ncbi:MAG: CHRD domain-containing protein [Verrucomicrobia bacterium]|nr:CHRD domain-containing protein [Verrucomicrobiota bacterium]
MPLFPRQILAYASTAAVLLVGSAVQARQCRVTQLPGQPFIPGTNTRATCTICHLAQNGGGSRNAFGVDVEPRVNGSQCTEFWSRALAELDSDGDGFTNGEELGDPEGDGPRSTSFPATLPGDAGHNPIGNKMPIVAISSPAANANIPADAFFTIEATASDTDGTITKVEFFDGTTRLGESATAPFSVRVRLAPGSHSLTARATDDRRGTKSSSSISMRVSAPIAMKMAGGSREESGGVRLNWEGGIGPFILQRKLALQASAWENLPAVLERTLVLPGAAPVAFFRVTDLGQVDSIPLSVSLSGTAERPEPVTTDAAGSGLLRIEADSLVFDVRTTGLGGRVAAAHIHGPAAIDELAPPLFDLEPFAVGVLNNIGAVAGTLPLTPEQKLALVNGNTYVNFHTPENPRGEVRGQIAPAVMQAVLLGLNERPEPVVTDGSGVASLRLVGNQLSFNLSYFNLSAAAVAAHIHGPAERDTTGGVMITLDPYCVGKAGTRGAYAGTVMLNPAQLAAVIAGKTYFNIHTPDHPRGEIRGQILPHVTTIPFSVAMGGDAERPAPVQTAGKGLGLLGMEDGKLMVNVAYAGLSGPATAAHIHGSGRSTNTANPMIDLASIGWADGTQGGFFGLLSITNPTHLSNFRGGVTYLNVHTAANVPGEIRGQIIPMVLKSSLASSNEVDRPPLPSTATGRATVFIAHANLHFHLSYSGLTSAASAAHIHGPATAIRNAPPIWDLDVFRGDGAGQAGSYAGTIDAALTPLGWISDLAGYFNIHTQGNPAGEIRGQIIR